MDEHETAIISIATTYCLMLWLASSRLFEAMCCSFCLSSGNLLLVEFDECRGPSGQFGFHDR